MTSILARGAAFLHGKLEDEASETVLVTRGSQVLCAAWLATAARSQLESLADGTVTVLSDRLDWSGAIEDWKEDGAVTQPKRGDLIRWERGDWTLTFECLPANGVDAWAPAGAHGERMRVHTKLKDRVSNE